MVLILEYAGWQSGNVFSAGRVLSVILEEITYSGSGFTVGRFALFIFLEIGDESTNISSYAQCATSRYLKTVHFSSVNREPLNFEPELRNNLH